MKVKKRLGEIMMEAGLINEYQLAIALGQHKQWGEKLGSQLIKLGFIREEDLAYVLQHQMGIKWLSLRDIEIETDAIGAVSVNIAKKYGIMPIGLKKKNTLIIATTDPTDLRMLDTISFNVGKKLEPVIATISDIEWAIGRYYEGMEYIGTGMQNEKEKLSMPQDPMLKLKKEIFIEHAFETLVELLAEKGLLKKEEFIQKLENNIKRRNQ